VIPDWFEPLTAATRRELDTAEQRLADTTAERARRQTALHVAEQRYQQTAHRTQPERDALTDARRTAERARHNRDAATRRLNTVGPRGRRHARLELDVAQRRLDRADQRLQHTEHQTAPAIEAFNAARRDGEHARTDLRHHDLARQLDRYIDDPQAIRARLAALDTWQHWAKGDTVKISELAVAVAALTEPNVDHRLHALGDSLLAWADAAGLEHHLLRPQRATLRRTGLELGL
jgi:chromosome segregation ATPase